MCYTDRQTRDAKSPALRSYLQPLNQVKAGDQKYFPLVPPLVFRPMMKNFRKLSFDTPFKKCSPA